MHSKVKNQLIKQDKVINNFYTKHLFKDILFVRLKNNILIEVIINVNTVEHFMNK